MKYVIKYGNQLGKYTSQVGIPYEQRTLPYIESLNAYHKYEVLKTSDNVTMIGDYRDWVRLGMKSIDIGVYQKWINKNEAEIKILKENYKLNK